MQNDPIKIAQRYLKKHFAEDFLFAIPWNDIGLLFDTAHPDSDLKAFLRATPLVNVSSFHVCTWHVSRPSKQVRCLS